MLGVLFAFTPHMILLLTFVKQHPSVLPLLPPRKFSDWEKPRL